MTVYNYPSSQFGKIIDFDALWLIIQAKICHSSRMVVNSIKRSSKSQFASHALQLRLWIRGLNPSADFNPTLAPWQWALAHGIMMFQIKRPEWTFTISTNQTWFSSIASHRWVFIDQNNLNRNPSSMKPRMAIPDAMWWQLWPAPPPHYQLVLSGKESKN